MAMADESKMGHYRSFIVTALVVERVAYKSRCQ